MNITSIRFDRVALIDAGWDLNDNPNSYDGEEQRRVVEAVIENPKSNMPGAHAVIVLRELGNVLEMRCDSQSEESLNRIFSFLNDTKTPYITH